MKLSYVPIINWLGASSFAVYLLHGEPTVRHKLFIPIINNIYESNSGIIAIILIFLFLLLIYGVSCAIDQLRLFSWKCIVENKEKRKPLEVQH